MSTRSSTPKSIAQRAPRDASALLRDRTFGPYFAGNLVSNCGNWIQNIAAATAVFSLTGSATLTGVVSGALWVGALLLQPYAGTLTDRLDRRRLLLAGQGTAFLAATVLAVWTQIVGLQGLPGPWPIIAVTLVIGVGNAVAIPASQALVPALIPAADLDEAVALNSITYTLGRSLGPVFAAGLLAVGGPPLAFSVNAASYLALIVALMVIRQRQVERDRGDGSLAEVVAYLRRTPYMMVLLAVVAAIGWSSDPLNTLTPPVAELLGGGEALVGVLVGAFGGGAAVAGTIVTRVRERLGASRQAVAGLTTFSAGVAAFGLSPSAAVALVSLAIAGVGFLFALTTVTTHMQREVPEALRGRLMALWGVAFLGVRPPVAVLDGAIADAVGARVAVLVAALPVLIAAVVLHRRVTLSAQPD